MFQPLRKYIKKRVRSYSFKDELQAQEALSLYEERVEKVLGKEVEAESFKDGVLRVSVPNSAVAQELKLLEPKIKKGLKGVDIKRVVYSISD